MEEQYLAIANLIKESSRYADIASVKLTINGAVFKTNNFEETSYRISSDVRVLGKKIGTLKLCYLNELSEVDKEHFLNNEENLPP